MMHVCVWLTYGLEEHEKYGFWEVQKCNCGKMRVIPLPSEKP